MNKQNIGKIIYFVSLLIGLVLVLYGIIFLASEKDENITRTRYILSFIAFALIFPIGFLSRELLTMDYNLKRIKLKIIIAIIIFIVGTIFILLIETSLISQLAMYASLISLSYIFIPSKINGNKTNKI